MGYADTWGAQDAFRRYEEVRHRLPQARFPAQATPCSGLLEMADQVDAFLLDSFGVLNVGESAIAGAADCLASLRAMGKRLIVLTNAASYTRDTAIARYQRLGFDFTAQEVVSSRDVAVRRLGDVLPAGKWGAIAAPGDRFEDIIGAQVDHWDGADVDGFLILSSAALDGARLSALEAALRARPRPVVVANPDLVAPREGGLSKEPGFYAHYLADQLDLSADFYGKPFGDAFDDACARLEGIARARIAMVGDTLHTDILGGRAAGMKTVLVRRHGLFEGLRAETFVEISGITPDFICDRIADPS